MMNPADDPVPAASAWAMRLRAFLHECVASAPCEEPDRVREAALLLRDDPRAHDPAPAEPGLLEAMLGCGAAESAVLRIIGPDAPFMLSRGQGNICLATMVVAAGPDDVGEIISEASTLALALLAAHVAGVIAGIDDKGATGDGLVDPHMRRH